MSQETKEKILCAARKVFEQKGYEAARTRDIALEANVNVALINYHFQSKEQLFWAVVQNFLEPIAKSLREFFNDEKSDFETTLGRIVNYYTDTWIRNYAMIIVVLTELSKSPEKFKDINIKPFTPGSAFEKKVHEYAGTDIVDASQVISNTLAMTMGPIIIRPLIQCIGEMDDKQFNYVMDIRRKMIPFWIINMIKYHIENTQQASTNKKEK